MEIDPAEPGDWKKAGGNDLAVGDDDDDVRSEALQERLCFGRADFFGLMDRDAGSESGFLDRGRGELLAASTGAVGLRDYGGDFEVGLGEEMLERGDGEVRGAAEDEAERRHILTTRLVFLVF